MPERDAARALGVSVHTVRKSVIRGSLQARVTAAGIPEVLVCLNPWVAAGDSGQNVTIEPGHKAIGEAAPSPVAARPFEYALAGMNKRERITWMVAVLAFLLLVSLTIHAKRIQAGTIRTGSVGAT